MRTKLVTTELGLQPVRGKPVLADARPLVDGTQVPVGDTLALVDGRPDVVVQHTVAAV